MPRTTLSLTVVSEPVEGGWTQAHIAELPAVITAAPTAPAATAQVADALREYLLSSFHAPSHQVVPEATTGVVTLTIEVG